MNAATCRNIQPLIMYLDIDAFFPSVEQAKFPELRGKPVIVGSGVVASCSYEARRYGISAGTPIVRALDLCPDAIVLKGHQHTYRSFAQHIFDYCKKLTPLIEVYLDEIFCDLTATPVSKADPATTGRNLKAAIEDDLGLTVTIGFGTNRMIAKLAAKDVKPDGVAVISPGVEEDFMSERPIGDVPGIGYKATRILNQINVRCVKDLKRFPPRYLDKIFGKIGFLIHERLRGRDPSVTCAMPRSISRETSFARDTIDLDEILSTLYYLTERACRSARTLEVLPRRVQVKVRYGDGTCETRSQICLLPCVLDRALFEIARGLFMTIYRRCRVHLVGVALTGLIQATDRQQELYPQAPHMKLSGLYDALDSIRSKFGHSSVIAGRSINLIDRLERDAYGYILRTPSLTK